MTLTQTDVAILDNTVVDCTAYGHYFTDAGTSYFSTFTISIDGVPCGAIQFGAGRPDAATFVLFGGDLTVVGDTHTIVVSMMANLVDGNGGTMLMDNVQIVPIAGPGAVPVCAKVLATKEID